MQSAEKIEKRDAVKWIFAYSTEYESGITEFETYEEAKKEYDHWNECVKKDNSDMTLYLCEINSLSRSKCRD